jgi:hypothetical protein
LAHGQPDIDPERKLELVRELMRARRAVREAKSSGNLAEEAAAQKAVGVAKRALSERGPVWWRGWLAGSQPAHGEEQPVLILAARTI